MGTQSRKNFGTIGICSAVDTDGNRLGWAVGVLVESDDLTEIEASQDDAQEADLLILRHCPFEVEALVCKESLLNMLASDRRLIQKLASIREFWELYVTSQPAHEPDWRVLDNIALTEFKSGDFTLVFKPGDWHPNEADSLTHWLESYSWGNERFAQQTGVDKYFPEPHSKA